MLRTFGYEGLDISAFVRRLKAGRVRTVVDVRELPLSRKQGFSKRAFAEKLAGSGIAYIHMPALGCPKSIRDSYKESGDWKKYEKAFTSYLKTQAAEISALVNIATSTDACLVCFEADFNRCHRRLVALATGLEVQHLTAKTVVPEQSPPLQA